MRIYAYKAIKVKVAAIINDRCRFNRHYKTLWWLTVRIWQHNLYAQKKCPSQDSDFITKFDQHKDAQFLDRLRLVTQALEIKAKAVYRRIVENPCVGGSIPPRATKNLYSPLVGLFSFKAWQDVKLNDVRIGKQ